MHNLLLDNLKRPKNKTGIFQFHPIQQNKPFRRDSASAVAPHPPVWTVVRRNNPMPVAVTCSFVACFIVFSVSWFLYVTTDLEYYFYPGRTAKRAYNLRRFP